MFPWKSQPRKVYFHIHNRLAWKLVSFAQGREKPAIRSVRGEVIYFELWLSFGLKKG